jgi:hypothetical protein
MLRYAECEFSNIFIRAIINLIRVSVLENAIKILMRSLGKSKFIPIWIFGTLAIILLVACMSQPQQSNTTRNAKTFNSNGERIYLTATSDRGTNITYTDGPSSGMMGGGSSGGMMGANGNLTCASCHGADGRGSVHTMMGMQTMNSPDIRWSTLKSEFDAEKFRLAVTKGQDPDGHKQLNKYMPRWKIGNDDLADLITYLKTLP